MANNNWGVVMDAKRSTYCSGKLNIQHGKGLNKVPDLFHIMRLVACYSKAMFRKLDTGSLLCLKPNQARPGHGVCLHLRLVNNIQI
jgi:hypothetical protein